MSSHSVIVDLGYIAASILFILGLKLLSRPESARRGNLVSAIGMLVAIVVTLVSGGMSYTWIAAGLVLGSLIGIIAARTVKMTGMPEMVALFNGFGGAASLLVGWAEFHGGAQLPAFTLAAIVLAIIIGGVTFSGSLVAYGKLSETLPGKPLLFGGQQFVNIAALAGIVATGVLFVIGPDWASRHALLIACTGLAFLLGVMGVVPIGGADMPVVISLLNSYSGLAACAAGFVILNNVLIVSGALVGASGIILTSIMCKAMNRSLSHVLFSGFGAAGGAQGGAGVQGKANPIVPEDAYYLLEAARSAAIIPGYGMAVAQAQHAVRELAELLEANGTEIQYAIHPVAGRMPGHMNVLLAEANVPYEQLVEMDDINPVIDTIDVCIVIGANDVVNPSAREDESSAIYGMPIINADFAKTVLVLKRSLGSGFAGVANPLFFKENTRMLFGDAKATLQSLVAQFKES
jgi:NAD(P) transhydrogenase subunit beta